MNGRTARLVAPALGVALVLGGCASAASAPGGSTSTSSASAAGSAGPSPQSPISTLLGGAAASPPNPSATIAAASAAPPGAVTVGLRSFSFTPSLLTVHAGTAVFFLANTDTPVKLAGSDHDFVIDVNGTWVVAPRLAAGQAEVLTVSGLPTGTYPFFCSIPGHRAMGMEGTLTVAP